jgi:hypothetical protein
MLSASSQVRVPFLLAVDPLLQHPRKQLVVLGSVPAAHPTDLPPHGVSLEGCAVHRTLVVFLRVLVEGGHGDESPLRRVLSGGFCGVHDVLQPNFASG